MLRLTTPTHGNRKNTMKNHRDLSIIWDLVGCSVGCIPNWKNDCACVRKRFGYPNILILVMGTVNWCTNEFFGYLIFRNISTFRFTPFQVPSQLMGEKWWKLIFLDTNFCSKPPAGYTVCGIATDCIFHSTTEDLYPVLESCLQLRPFDVQLRHGELVLPRRTDFHRFPKQESFFLMVFPILHYDYGDIMAQWDMMEYNGYHYGHSVYHGVHWSL